MLFLSKRANSEITLPDPLSSFVGFGNREVRSSVPSGILFFLRRNGNHDDILAVVADEGEGVKLKDDVRVRVPQTMAGCSPFYGVVISLFVRSLPEGIIALWEIGQLGRRVLADKRLSLYWHCAVRQHAILCCLRVADKQSRPQANVEQGRADMY